MRSWKHHLIAATTTLALALGPLAPVALAQESAQAANKDETVYVYTAPSGSIREVTVRNLLANEEGAKTLVDKSSLEDLTVSGDDVSLKSQKGTDLVWDAQGNEVQYKGTSTDTPPIELRVSYTLNGIPTAPDQLVGRSGHVVMRLEYLNNSTQKATIDGKDTTIFTPFVAMCTVNLDREAFSGVRVTNGRLIDGADSLSVVGYAMPGLQESLDIDAEDLEIPSYVQVEADVKDFHMGSVLTIVTPEVFSGMDTSDLDTSELTDARDGLTEAMDALVEGTNSLADGLSQLSEGQEALAGGLAQLAQAANALPSASQSLAQGAGALQDGIRASRDGASQLAAGSQQVIDGLQKTQQLADGIDTALGGTNQGLTGAGAAVGAAKDALDAISVSELDTQIQALSDLATSETDTDKKATIEATVKKLEELKASLANIDIAKTSLGTATTTIAGAQEGVGAATQLNDTMSTSLQGLTVGSQTVTGGIETLQQGLAELTNVAGKLTQGLSSFSAQMPQLTQGIGTLQQGAQQLSAGAQAAAEGSAALASGTSQFNEEGIKELVSKLDESGIASLGDRLEALSKAADSYQTFSGLADGQTGSVKFFIKTDAIGE